MHTPSDQYSYFNEDIKNKMIEISLRNCEPYSGKFDWDARGTLQGSWFVEGSSGYDGLVGQQYWDSHLSFSPTYLDCDYSHFTISMGDYNGKEEQFGAIGNSPLPIDVTPNSGLVKYELTTFEFYDVNGQRWDRQSLVKIDEVKNENFVIGTVLVEMLDSQKIKFEAFPELKASQVSSFTENAKIYIR